MTIHIENVHIDKVVFLGQAVPPIRWHIGPMVFLQKGASMPVDVITTIEHKVRVRITPLTPGGDPAKVDGQPQWAITGSGTLASPAPEDPQDVEGTFSMW